MGILLLKREPLSPMVVFFSPSDQETEWKPLVSDRALRIASFAVAIREIRGRPADSSLAAAPV
jgi:hypothetical protein